MRQPHLKNSWVHQEHGLKRLSWIHEQESEWPAAIAWRSVAAAVRSSWAGVAVRAVGCARRRPATRGPGGRRPGSRSDPGHGGRSRGDGKSRVGPLGRPARPLHLLVEPFQSADPGLFVRHDARRGGGGQQRLPRCSTAAGSLRAAPRRHAQPRGRLLRSDRHSPAPIDGGRGRQEIHRLGRL